MTEDQIQKTSRRQDLIRNAMKWWAEIQDPKHRGDRAELRRCRGPADVAFVPAYYRLKAMMPDDLDAENLAVVAGILSHVDDHIESPTTAEIFARPKDGGTSPRVSDPRFRRLLRVGDYDYQELYPMLTRLIRQTERKAHLPSLIAGAYWWNQTTKRAWAEEYYEHIPKTEE